MSSTGRNKSPKRSRKQTKCELVAQSSAVGGDEQWAIFAQMLQQKKPENDPPKVEEQDSPEALADVGQFESEDVEPSKRGGVGEQNLGGVDGLQSEEDGGVGGGEDDEHFGGGPGDGVSKSEEVVEPSHSEGGSEGGSEAYKPKTIPPPPHPLLQASSSNSSWSKSNTTIIPPAQRSSGGSSPGLHRTPSSGFLSPPDPEAPIPTGAQTERTPARPSSTLSSAVSTPTPIALADAQLPPPLSPSAARASTSRSPRMSRPRVSRFSPKSRPKEEKEGGQDGVLKSGWLMRKTGKKWSKKWFIVRVGSVSYYDDAASSHKTPKFTLPLRRGVSRVVLRGSATETKTFGLVWSGDDGPGSGGSMDLQARKIGEVVEWMSVLESAFVEEGDGSFCSLSQLSLGNSFGSVKKEQREEHKDLGKYEAMAELVTKEEHAMLRRVIEESVAKKDEKKLAGEMVHTFEMKGRTMGYLEELIASSIESCVRPNTLFRGNGVTEKALTSYCYLVGSDYLKKALKPLFLSVLNSSCSYEVDPAKIQRKADLQGNIVNLLSVSEMFMAKITSSKFTNVPYSIRVVCRKLAVATNAKFPDGLYSVLGGLFFLRFICPALTVPTEMGIWPSELTPNAKRALLLISKTLMNLSNGVRFGHKEEYMIPMNEFIDKNDANLRTFFDQLILEPSKQDEDQREEEEELKAAEGERWALAKPNFEKLGSLAKHLDHQHSKIAGTMEKKKKIEAKEKGEKEGGEEIPLLLSSLKKSVSVPLK